MEARPAGYFEDLPADAFAPGPGHKTLDIAIVGAGIAGLGAAIGLLQAGHKVEIFEQSRFSNEIGAAIHMAPNASRVLRHWGFDLERAQAIEVEEGRLMKGDTLHVFHFVKYDDLLEKYGSEWDFLHRVDLHSELKRMALDNPGPGIEPAKINLSAKVVDVDCESGTLTLADGRTFKKDVIVAADGVHSVIVPKVTGFNNPAVATGQSAYRFLIPTKKLIDNPETRSLFENIPPTFNVAVGPDRRLVWYPIRGNELQNFVAIHPDREINSDLEDWDAAAPLEDLVATYKNFHPAIVEVCRNAEDLKLWKLLFRTPLSTWTKGKVVLIGDAAHPMLPHQGQGGCQAIEDGGAIGALLSNLTSVDDVPARLHLFQETRKFRTAAMQIFSNVGQEEAEKVEEEARPYVKGPIPKNPAQFNVFNFSYHVLRECQTALEAQGPSLAVTPNGVKAN